MVRNIHAQYFINNNNNQKRLYKIKSKFTHVIFLSVIPLIFASLILVSGISSASAIGPYPCFFYLGTFNKVTYSPGDTITIQASHCHSDSNETATVTIVNGMGKFPSSNTLQEYLSGKNILYQQSKQAVKGYVEFNYTIPKSQDIYRYLVLVSPGGMGDYDFGYFFTKPDANKIIISDAKILNPEVKQGENLRFEMKVTDGLGNPLPFFAINPTADYTSCDGNTQLQNVIAITDRPQSEQDQYASNGKIWGWLAIPQGSPGTYDLSVEADTVNYIEKDRWSSDTVTGLKFKVLGDTTVQNELDLFADYGTSTTEPSSQENPKVLPNSTSDHLLDVRTGDKLFLTGQTSHNHCVLSSDVMPVDISLTKMTMNMTSATKQFGLNAIKYGSDISCYKFPTLCASENVKTIELKTNPGMYFNPLSEFYDLASKNPGEYTINFTANYQNTTFTNSVGVRVHNVKDYTINAEGQDFAVSVDAWYSNPLGLQFDQPNKKITLDVDTSKGPKVVDIFIPYELLDGGLTVFMNGEKTTTNNMIIQNGEKSSHVTLFPATNHTNIEITGTTAIPEFPFVMPILLVSIISLIVFYKTKFRK